MWLKRLQYGVWTVSTRRVVVAALAILVAAVSGYAAAGITLWFTPGNPLTRVVPATWKGDGLYARIALGRFEIGHGSGGGNNAFVPWFVGSTREAISYDGDFRGSYALLGEPLGVWRARFEFVPWKRLAIPLWPLAGAACLWLVLGISRLDGTRCPCGYELKGLKAETARGIICPECGRSHTPVVG